MSEEIPYQSNKALIFEGGENKRISAEAIQNLNLNSIQKNSREPSPLFKVEVSPRKKFLTGNFRENSLGHYEDLSSMSSEGNNKDKVISYN